MAAKAKRKQRRRRDTASTPAPATAGTSGSAKPAKRLERRVAENRAHDVETRKDRPHALDVRYGVVRPKPIWAPFPLTELALVIGIGMFAAGFIIGSDSGSPLIGAGALIATVAVSEQCIREHWGGFKSHSLLLGFLPVVAVHSFVYFVISDQWAGPAAVFVDVFIAGFLIVLLHSKFRAAHKQARDRVAAAR